MTPPAGTYWRSMVKVALLTGFALVAVIAAVVVALVLFPDPFVNSVMKPVLVREWAAAMPDHDLSLGTLKVSVSARSGRV